MANVRYVYDIHFVGRSAITIHIVIIVKFERSLPAEKINYVETSFSTNRMFIDQRKFVMVKLIAEIFRKILKIIEFLLFAGSTLTKGIYRSKEDFEGGKPINKEVGSHFFKSLRQWRIQMGLAIGTRIPTSANIF